MSKDTLHPIFTPSSTDEGNKGNKGSISSCIQEMKSGKNKGKRCGGKISTISTTGLYCNRHIKSEKKTKSKKEMTEWAKNIIHRMNGTPSEYAVVDLEDFYFYPKYNFIIDSSTNKVVGYLYKNTVRELIKKDLEICSMYNFEYELPQNLNNEIYSEQPILCTLTDIQLKKTKENKSEKKTRSVKTSVAGSKRPAKKEEKGEKKTQSVKTSVAGSKRSAKKEENGVVTPHMLSGIKRNQAMNHSLVYTEESDKSVNQRPCIIPTRLVDASNSPSNDPYDGGDSVQDDEEILKKRSDDTIEELEGGEGDECEGDEDEGEDGEEGEEEDEGEDGDEGENGEEGENGDEGKRE